MSVQHRSVVAMVSDVIYPYHHGSKEVRYPKLARRLVERAEIHVGEQKDVYALTKAAKVIVFPSAREGSLGALVWGLPVVTMWEPDNLAQHLTVRSSRGIVCDPSAPDVAEAMKRMRAESGSRFGDDDGIDASWLAEYSLETAPGRIAEVLVI